MSVPVLVFSEWSFHCLFLFLVLTVWKNMDNTKIELIINFLPIITYYELMNKSY